MKRLIEKIVFCGFVTAWRLATVPTSLSPEAVKATTEGVVRPPSAFSMTVGSPPSSTAMHELVVPRSMPMVLAIGSVLLHKLWKNLSHSVADFLHRFKGLLRSLAPAPEPAAAAGRLRRTCTPEAPI